MNTATRSRAASAAAANSSPKRDWASQVSSGGSNKPTRAIFHGVEGVGKTSFAAQAPKPVFLMARGETGLDTLISSGCLGETPHFPETQTWQEALSQIDWLIESEHPHKTLVLDTLNGLERLCHEHVCQRDYGGEWGKSGFTSYMQGFEVSLADWRELLALLDRLRDRKAMGIVCLCHTKVAPFRNPEGADYDRYAPDMHQKTWGLTHKWADLVGFMNFEVVVQEERGTKRGKGHGGQARMLYLERHAAYDAKNRLGLPEAVSLGNTAQEAWANFMAAVKAARKQDMKA